MRCFYIPCLAFLLLPAEIRAQTAAPTAPDASEFQPNTKPVVEARRAAGPIRIDGELDDAGWAGAARATNFTEFFPGDQTQPPVETEVLVTYDEKHLYFAFRAHGNPKEIRVSQRARDEIWQDDVVGVLFDTYGDDAWGYFLIANAYGIQGDERFTPQGEDESFDIIFDSDGKITETGYQVEMAIPFSSLRFPDRPQQSWKINFYRNHPRTSRHQMVWAPIKRDNRCVLCQSGRLTGIEGVKPGGQLELLPAIVASQAGELSSGTDPSSFESGDPSASVSLGVRYPFTAGWTAEATLNPDFSQVESDAAQIDVNTTFALFFPERRPFFQEGGDLFDTWVDVVYTRSINDPVFAAKLTGRRGRTSVSYLAAVDEHSPVILPFEERSAILQNGRSISNIVRARRSIGEESYIAGILTDRRIDRGGAGTVLGADGLVRFSKTYRLEWQVLASHTDEPRDTALTHNVNSITFDEGKRTAAYDGESYWGRASYISLERNAPRWNFDIDYWDATPTYRAENGFQTRNNFRRAIVFTGWEFRPGKYGIDELNPGLRVRRGWNFEGARKEQGIEAQVVTQLVRQTFVYASYGISDERFRGIDFRDVRRWQMNVNSNFSAPFSAGFYLSHGHSIARNLAMPVLGTGTTFSAWGTLKPTQRFVIQPEYSYSELQHPDGSEIFAGYILRTRINYQFTRELFLRFITQYNDFNHSLDVEPLLMYQLNPFSIFYVGSTHGFREFDEPAGTGYEPTSRQFFLKFQYLVRR